MIGVEPTDTLHDLAVVSTILAAAPYQRIRCEQLEQRPQALSQEARPILQQQKKSAGDKHHDSSFLLARSDLRRYRRAPATDLMLLILLDYTSLRDRNWRESLLPYLIRAYVERASIAIVQVGMKGAVHELRAEVVSARSIRAPGIDDALVDAYGRATPLAHGFDLALQTLRHALQHGRNTSHHALLVIISDGRGNVPLEGSRTGCISQPVGRKGVEDTLQIAQEIRDLKEVEKVLLNPEPELYADLPLLLAEAVGAVVEDIPRLNGGGVH